MADEKYCDCLNNETQIKSDLIPEADISSNVSGVVEVSKIYNGGDTSDISLNVNNETNIITATLQKMWFFSFEEFPEIGSDNLIYADATTGIFYVYDKEIGVYKKIVEMTDIKSISVNGEKIELDENKNADIPKATADKLGVVSVDAEIDSTSENPVQNKVVKDYVDDKFNGSNKAVSYTDYGTMVTALNTATKSSLNWAIGQNIMIVTLAVPDLWVSEVAEESKTYTYTNDEVFINDLTTNGSVQVGYYKLSALETQKVDLTNYVKNTDYATSTTAGIVKVNTQSTNDYGIMITSGKIIQTIYATKSDILKKENYRHALSPVFLDYAIKVGLTTNKEEWTDEDRASARELLGIYSPTMSILWEGE